MATKSDIELLLIIVAGSFIVLSIMSPYLSSIGIQIPFISGGVTTCGSGQTCMDYVACHALPGICYSCCDATCSMCCCKSIYATTTTRPTTTTTISSSCVCNGVCSSQCPNAGAACYLTSDCQSSCGCVNNYCSSGCANAGTYCSHPSHCSLTTTTTTRPSTTTTTRQGTTTTTTTTIPHQQDLVVYYKFDETEGATAYDSSGNHNNGALKPDATDGPAWVNGAKGKALQFDGINDYVLVNNSVDFAKGNYSIAGWFKTSAFGVQHDILAATNSSDNNHGILIEIQADGKLRYLHRYPSSSDASKGTNVYSKDSYNDGNWHHFATVKQGSTMSLYLDAVLLNTSSDDTSFTYALDVVIGKLSKTASSRYFNGTIDEIHIYKTALTADEIKTLYDEVNPSPRGNLTSASCSSFTGWACDASDYSKAINVSFYKDNPADSGGVFIGSVVANTQTSDNNICKACGNICNHTFTFEAPDAVQDAKNHSVYAYAIDGTSGNKFQVVGSPKKINCTINYSNFNCDNSTKTCSLTYDNKVGENLVIVFYLLKSQKLRQAIAFEVGLGSNTFTAPGFSCGSLEAGQYNVMFQVFRKSDTGYRYPIKSPTESKDLTCP